MVDLSNKTVLEVQVDGVSDKPTVIRWHPKREGLATVGYKSGRISFVDVMLHKTFTKTLREAFPEATELQEDFGGGVSDLAWD